MFGESIISKRVEKKNKLLLQLEEAKAQKKDWKVKQIESKIYDFEKKYYPKVLFSGGTYRKK